MGESARRFRLPWNDEDRNPGTHGLRQIRPRGGRGPAHRGTVVNGDPFQAIAGLAIGTGQPSQVEQGGVPHVGYGLLPLSTRPNPATFGSGCGPGWRHLKPRCW